MAVSHRRCQAQILAADCTDYAERSGTVAGSAPVAQIREIRGNKLLITRAGTHIVCTARSRAPIPRRLSLLSHLEVGRAAGLSRHDQGYRTLFARTGFFATNFTN